MSKRSWILLGIGGTVLIIGKVLLFIAATHLRGQFKPDVRAPLQDQMLQYFQTMMRSYALGYAFVLVSLVVFGFAAWGIYHETQLPKPGDRPPRQRGGGGF
jgi:hypothetical protein